VKGSQHLTIGFADRQIPGDCDFGIIYAIFIGGDHSKTGPSLFQMVIFQMQFVSGF
jgi:hypothetical protein